MAREWITGRNPVYEVLRARRRQPFRLWVASGAQEKGRLAEIVRLVEARQIPVEKVPRSRLDALSANHQGVALETSGYPYSGLADILELARERDEDPWILILDTVQNPQNLGTLLRTGEAAGIHGAILPLRHAAGVTPAVVSASAGASEHLLVAQANLAQAIAQLKEAGVWVVGLESGADALPAEKIRLDGPLAIVVGSEGEGMRQLVRQSCDWLLRLPMHGKIESLNAAAAGSIVLYLVEARRSAKQLTQTPK
ncbi:MAG: 23S rRNA (guanosine(2251)-2'-O)-methyltransferase RlmB [Chloroflexi bacterium]|nr:23S rRNA (guanosine(2251)-2'-O)-methyltransferase RlmB [Chloroflexota bacterium]